MVATLSNIAQYGGFQITLRGSQHSLLKEENNSNAAQETLCSYTFRQVIQKSFYRLTTPLRQFKPAGLLSFCTCSCLQAAVKLHLYVTICMYGAALIMITRIHQVLYTCFFHMYYLIETKKSRNQHFGCQLFTIFILHVCSVQLLQKCHYKARLINCDVFDGVDRQHK